MNWLKHIQNLQEPCVMVTVAQVRGHAPRNPGAKMIVTTNNIFGSVGGGNLEESAIVEARKILQQQKPQTSLLQITLSEKAHNQHGIQCCGGEVTLMLEYMAQTQPQIVLFGAGHVGVALTRVLSGLPINILVIDSRNEMLNDTRFAHCLDTANIKRLHAPIPETAFEHVQQNACVFVLTHDHAEDLMILDAALRRKDLKYVGLIGSKTKWQNFKNKLLTQGFTEQDLIRITTPIGVAGLQGKQPEQIAIAAAAQVLGMLELAEG